MKHGSPADDLRIRAEEVGASLDGDQIRKLLRYEQLLLERAIPMGLIAQGDARSVRSRHVLDCLRATPLLDGVLDAYDLGSGAGLPGIVLAIARPGLEMGLVDSRRKRVSFLELVVEDLGLSHVTTLGVRAEALSEPRDACFARAFATAEGAWAAAERLLRPEGRLIYFAGREDDSSRAEPLPIPAGARLVGVLETPVLESAGSLAIMARQ